MHSFHSRHPPASMTWNSSARLTPSPEPSGHPTSNEKLVHYATPPSSPTALQRASEAPFARTVPVMMESTSSRYFGNDSCQTSRDHSTAIFSQVTYPLEQGYGLHYTTAPHMQNNPTMYDTESSPINQRQYRYPAYSSSLMYNNAVETPALQSTGQHLSGFDPVQQYSTSHPPSPSALDISTRQFGVPQHYYNAADQSSSTLMNAGPAYSIVQQRPLDQPSYQGSRASATHQSVPVGIDLCQSSSTDAHNMSNKQPASALAEALYGDVNYEKFAEMARKVYLYVQEGRLTAAGGSILELSGWLMKVLARSGLTQDDVSQHELRLQLWKDFNHCWLALLQKQKDLSSSASSSSSEAGTAAPPRDLLQTDFLKHMGDELLCICDDAETHGLVDYELGFWEEEIMTVLIQCIDILEGNDSNSPSKAHNELLSKFQRSK